ncbi:integrase core domain-containing protein [Paenibacillus antri]
MCKCMCKCMCMCVCGVEHLEKEGVTITMDGKGRATDNSRAERFFRSIKYECIYINDFEDPRALRTGLVNSVQFYIEERPRQSLGEASPVQFFSHPIKPIAS